MHGLARAKDSDSLIVAQTEVRLIGVDAPELDQTCKKGGTVRAGRGRSARQTYPHRFRACAFPGKIVTGYKEDMRDIEEK